VTVAKIELRTPEGAPVQVETGVGRIVALIEKGTRNVQVHIDADHLREPVTGWVDKQGPMWPRVQWAKTNDAKIWYRVDLKRHRKATEAIDTPLQQLEKNSKTRDVVRIERPENAPLDDTIGLDPMVNQPTGRADAGSAGSSSSVGHPAATATDGHAPQGPKAPAAAARPPAGQQQPVTHPQGPQGPVQASQGPQQAQQQQGPPVNPSPRPQSSPPIPGPVLSPEMLDALHDVVQAVHARAEDAWVNDCCDAALATGCTREQVLHVLDRARRELDVGLQPRRPQQQGQQMGQELGDVLAAGARRGPEAEALSRYRDPDSVGERRPPAPDDTANRAAGEAPRRVQMGSQSGLTRRVLPIAGDEKRWVPFNSDGRPNMGSYGFGAVMEMVKLSMAQLMTRTRSRNAEDPSVPLEPPTAREVYDLSRTLLYLCDRVQFLARSDGDTTGRVDRMAPSHTAARMAVRDGMDVWPMPWGSDGEVWEQWREQVIDTAHTLIKVALAHYVRVEQDPEGPPTGAPDRQVPREEGENR
jgi:hypothetical protein